ncbi:hypothetical protein DOJK_01778 [Patescibacteria group bacterium]|nr:hypothetical protein [Candidatus Dojkabacteria bacterium]CAG1022605.1 hypothetical protein DOJK_01778 [Patescibacteria group bacterium]
MEIGLIAVFLCEGLLILFGLYLIWSWFTKTPFYPSKTKPLNDLIKDLNISADTNFVDIGSGDGRIVVWAAKKGFNAEGIEFNPFLSLISRALITLNRVGKNAQIFNKDFNNHNFSKYNVAYLYIFPEHMDKLENKLFNEMPAGGIVITNTFKFTNRQPSSTYNRYYIYKV